MSKNNSLKNGFSQKPSIEGDTRKEEKLGKRERLYLTKKINKSIASLMTKNSFSNSHKNKKSNRETMNLETNPLMNQPNNMHIMKLNMANFRKPIRENNTEQFVSSREGSDIDQKTWRFIKNNFEERIQNETFLRAFIDKINIQARFGF
jgi:hypothetical protein